MSRSIRAAMMTLIVALATMSLTACDSIPESGPVREGLESLDQGERGVLFNPSGPVIGADQEAIVRGFVRAASSSTNDYEVAREFLTPTYADNWDPTLGVLINEGAQQFESLEPGIAMLSLRVAATIDGSGIMTPAEPGRQTEVQFELTQVEGQWRISSAPAGIILDRNTFSTVWTTRQLHFVTEDQRLVPEVRWFLNRPTLPTQIVRGLLEGPGELMAPVLHTAFPQGTRLTSSAVPVVDGVAVIDLSAELFDADEATMTLLKRQLASSLQAVTGVSGFQLTVHGTAIEQNFTPVSEDTVTSERQYATVIKDGQLSNISANALKPLDALSERVVGLAPTAVTLSVDRSAAAVLGATGVTWVGQHDMALVDERRGLLAPSLDPLGFVWTYASSAPGEVIATAPGRAPIALPLTWLDDSRVIALRVSTGGDRIAALIERNEQTEVLVAGIIRSEEGQPIALTESAPTQIWEEGAPIDLDWIGDTRFAVLSQTGLLGGSARVTIGEIGRFSVEAGAVAAGVSIGGGGGRALLRVLDDTGRVYAPQGSGWQQVLTEVDLLAKAG